MDSLLQNPRKAERIATNNVKTFRERYLTPAAEACYWRGLWDGWAEVSRGDIEGDVPGYKWGLRFETFLLLGSGDMLRFSFSEYE
jgi:hypothetical protein